MDFHEENNQLYIRESNKNIAYPAFQFIKIELLFILIKRKTTKYPEYTYYFIKQTLDLQ